MPDQTSTQETTQPESVPKPTTPSTASRPLAICAGGLLICFFLPWVKVFGQDVTGFDLQKSGGILLFLWAIPFGSAASAILALAGRPVRNVAQMTGILPFLFLAYFMKDLGVNLIGELSFAGYGELALGVVLIILSRGWK